MKAALIGCGKAGLALLDDLLLNPKIKSIQVYDPNFHQIKSLYSMNSKVVFLHETSLNLDSSYDLVVIATPDHLHTKYMLEAINLGIHCFVEKPLVTTYQELKMIKSALEAKPNVKITSNLILRAAPLFIELQKAFHSRSFGSQVFVEGKYLYGRWEKLANGWRGSSEYSVILGGLIHLVDLLCYVTNNYEYESKIEYRRLTNKIPLNVNDFGSITLSSINIGLAHMTTSFSTPIEHRRDLAIYGDEGWIEIKGASISTGGKIADLNLENLKAIATSKGDLLRSFVSDITENIQYSTLYPTRTEMLKVLELCLDHKTI
jgi:predicted dehydrogenase